VKAQCSTTNDMLVTRLDRRFAHFELMNAFGIMYPGFWMQLDVDSTFCFHFAMIKKRYYETKKVRLSLLQVIEHLNANNLDLHASIFKLTMKSQAPKAMAELLTRIQ
jgi:hypothetical protein